MRLRVALLGVDEVWELGGVTNEEHGGVVEHPVPVALVGAQLERKATRIARGVGRPGLATDGGEPRGDAHLLADLPEQRLRGDVAQIVGDLEVAMRAGGFGVDNTLRDTLAIEVREEIDMVEVCDKSDKRDRRRRE